MLALPVQQIPWVSWKLASQLQTEVRPLFPLQSPGCRSPLQTWTANMKMKTPTDQMFGRLFYTVKCEVLWYSAILINHQYQSMIGLDQNPQKLVCSPALSTLWRHIRQYVSSFADPCCLLLLLTDLTSPFSRHSIPFFPDCRMWLADVYYFAGGKEQERVQNSWFAKGGGAKQLRNSYTRSTLANSSVLFIDKYQRHTNRNEWYWM